MRYLKKLLSLGLVVILFIALSGCSSDQLDLLGEEQAKFESTLNDMQAEINSLEEEIDSQDLVISSQISEINQLNDDILDINTEITALELQLETADTERTTLEKLLSTANSNINMLEQKVLDLDIQTQMTQIIDGVSESVVGVNVYDDESALGSGSGVIYKELNGVYYVVTNYHVVEGGTSFNVFLTDNSEVNAYLAGFDFYSDLAVLQFNSNLDIPIAPIGDSNMVNEGDFVVAIGSPLGMLNYNSITFGIVSGKNRFVYDDLDEYYGELYIQHDAPINPGNSGGALFDLDGNLIGINTLKFVSTSVEGMGFAIPSNTISNVVSFLGNGDPYPRTGNWYDWMININSIRNNPDDYLDIFIPNNIINGVYVKNPDPDGIFGIAGIEEGDIIIKIDGVEVNFWYEVKHMTFYQNTINDNMTFEIVRNNNTITLTYDCEQYIYGYYTYELVEYSDGIVYIGELYDSQRHGNGELYFGNGDEFIGHFSFDTRNGWGTYYWNSGDYFIGNWIDNDNATEGVYHYESGTIENTNLVDGEWVSY